MGTPALYLPPLQNDTVINTLLQSIGLPAASTITPLSVSAEYHRIYAISLAAQASDGDARSPNELILRVAGNHIPKIKTENEAGVITWLSKNTTIPIPRVIHFDASSENALGHEYILQERMPGKTVAEVYKSLADEQIWSIISQLSDYMLQLARKQFHRIGGLSLSTAEKAGEGIQVGPAVEEHFWHVADIGKYWPASESFDTLNISKSGYPRWSMYLLDRFRLHLHSIKVHPALAWLGEEGGRVLRQVIAYLESHEGSSIINDTPLRLAHRDLHFGNILVHPESCKITSLIDWEFAGVYPPPLGDKPSGPFLWNCRYDSESNTRKEGLHEIWRKQIRRKQGGEAYLEAMKWKHPQQEAIWEATNYMRCIVEVCPRNEKLELAKEWWKKVCDSIASLGSP